MLATQANGSLKAPSYRAGQERLVESVLDDDCGYTVGGLTYTVGSGNQLIHAQEAVGILFGSMTSVVVCR